MAGRLFGVAMGALAGFVSVPLVHWKVTSAATNPFDDVGTDLKSLDRIYKWILSRPPPQLWDSDWDHRDSETPNSPLQPRVWRHLYLIRHGQYVMSGTKGLTELGQKQAAATGARLGLLNNAVKFDYMVNSSQPRAMETADIIHSYLPKVPRKHFDNMLAEGFPCLTDPPVSPRPASVLYEDEMRIEAAFRRYFHRPPEQQVRDSHELLVCHANVIRFFVCRALQLPPAAWIRLSLDHCSITRVSIDSRGEVRLCALGDSGHLPPPLVSRHNASSHRSASAPAAPSSQRQ